MLDFLDQDQVTGLAIIVSFTLSSVAAYFVWKLLEKRQKNRIHVWSEQWEQETSHMSNTGEAAQHPLARKMVKLGPAVLPFMMEKIEKDQHFYLILIAEIVGEFPEIPHEKQGKVRDMCDIYIEWLEETQLPKIIANALCKLNDEYGSDTPPFKIKRNPNFQLLVSLGKCAIPHIIHHLKYTAGECPIETLVLQNIIDLDSAQAKMLSKADWINWHDGFLSR